MIYFSELMGADAEQIVRNSAIAHSGYANYLLETGDITYLPYSASSFTIAASLMALLDVRRAANLFNLAADNYQRDGNGYWKIVAICSKNFRRFEEFSQNAPSEEVGSFVDLLTSCFLHPANIERYVLDRNSADFLLPCGRTGTPMAYFVDAFLELINYEKGRNYDLYYCRKLLERAGESTNLIFGDRSRLPHIAASFLPFEPEVLAACMCLLRIAQEKRIAPQLITEKIAANSITKLPFFVAVELFSIN